MSLPDSFWPLYARALLPRAVGCRHPQRSSPFLPFRLNRNGALFVWSHFRDATSVRVAGKCSSNCWREYRLAVGLWTGFGRVRLGGGLPFSARVPQSVRPVLHGSEFARMRRKCRAARGERPPRLGLSCRPQSVFTGARSGHPPKRPGEMRRILIAHSISNFDDLDIGIP